MSGRGLGHTGGTLDKLESIPGFRTELTLGRVRRAGARGRDRDHRPDRDLVPADKLLYGAARRDGDGRPALADRRLDHVEEARRGRAGDRARRQGRGRRVHEDARGRAGLAETMLALGRHAGREVVCLLTDMDQPLGAAVGNALEVREARDTVRGHGPADFTELVLDACAQLLALSDLGIDEAEGRAPRRGRRRGRLRRGRLAAAGSRPRAAPPTSARCRSRRSFERCRRRAAGYVATSSAIGVGNAAVHLGAGRRTKDGRRSTTRSASSCTRSAATRVDDGRVARRGARTRPRRTADVAAAEVLAAYELADAPPAERAGAARGRH